MKKILGFLFLFCLFINGYAQKNLPSISIENLEEKILNLNEYSQQNILIISFWATWCEPCIKELNTLNQNLFLIEGELQSKLISISIDDSRTISRIIPMINGNNWNFDVYLDSNQTIKRSLNIIDIPHTMIVYRNKIIYEHSGYISGDEIELFEKIRKLNKG